MGTDRVVDEIMRVSMNMGAMLCINTLAHPAESDPTPPGNLSCFLVVFV